MRNLLVCLGEILIDFLPLETDGELTGFTLHPGGAPFNVAVGLARLGQPAAFVGKLGADVFGRRLRRAVRAEGIDDAWLTDAPAPTTLAFVAHEDGEPVFTFYGAGAADTLLTPADLPPALFERAASLHFGGISLLRGATPTAALAAAEGLRGRALVSLDVNVRPRLIDDPAAYRATLARAIAACDLLKLSAADCAWLAPADDPLRFAATRLDAGPTLVALTRGSAGVTVLRRRDGQVETLEVPGFSVAVADTVGAGDSFSAGLLAALAERAALTREALATLPVEDLTAALRFAAAVAALTCTRPGADPPRRAEVAAFLAAQ
ncbi:MAG: carbohydrate kinase [Chloroflexaceae bacterium]|nr:carbohydrate kinase [Chloroflexaceae bacterium]